MTVLTLKSAWTSLKTRFSAHHERIDRVHELYAAIVAQARRAFFYRDLRVPDSLDGRFDLIVLHLHLVARKLSASGDSGKDVEKGLLGLFFADMDRSLREMGVGDLSVGKKIRNMAEAYFGRAGAYEKALMVGDEGPLQDAITRNIYGGRDIPAELKRRMAAYIRVVDAEVGPLDAVQVVDTVEACFERGLHHVTAHASV